MINLSRSGFHFSQAVLFWLSFATISAASRDTTLPFLMCFSDGLLT